LTLSKKTNKDPKGKIELVGAEVKGLKTETAKYFTFRISREDADTIFGATSIKVISFLRLRWFVIQQQRKERKKWIAAINRGIFAHQDHKPHEENFSVNREISEQKIEFSNSVLGEG
jgi:hypothetical protein